MLLIHTPKITARVDFVFKHIFNRILGLEVGFTSIVEEFIAHEGPKISYGKQPMGSEIFVQSADLLFHQGIEDLTIQVKEWEDTHCFFPVGDKSIVPFDIFSAAFFLLSRYEEYLPHVKDELGRFPPAESVGGKAGFLQHPVVDIWAYKFKRILKSKYPEYPFPLKSSKVHSLVYVEQPFLYAQKGLIRSLVGYGKDLRRLRFRSIWQRTQVLLGFKEDPYNVYDWLIEKSRKSNNKNSFFFLLNDNPELARGFNSGRKSFQLLLKKMSDYNDVGIIFSPAAFQSIENLKEEKERLENITHKVLKSSMNADFLIRLPQIYRLLVEQEVKRDFSMVYDESAGFRAGTCTPFLFYDLDFEVKTPLEIHPIAFSTQGFNNKYESDSLQRIYKLYDEVMRYNGTFSVFFAIEDFAESNSNTIWRNLFSEKLNTHE